MGWCEAREKEKDRARVIRSWHRMKSLEGWSWAVVGMGMGVCVAAARDDLFHMRNLTRENEGCVRRNRGGKVERREGWRSRTSISSNHHYPFPDWAGRYVDVRLDCLVQWYFVNIYIEDSLHLSQKQRIAVELADLHPPLKL